MIALSYILKGVDNMANYCVNCGYKTDRSWKYCPKCGEQLPNLEDEILLKKDSDNLQPQKITTVKTFTVQKCNKQPTLPRKVDRMVLEGRLEEYRLAEKNRLNIPAYCIFNNSTLNAIVEQRNNILTTNDLYSIKGLGEKSIEKYGNDIISLLNELDQNYIP